LNLGAIGYLGLVVLVGLLCGKLAGKIHLPNVTGYLLGGLLFGPSVLNLFSAEVTAPMSIVSDIALGFVAFSIGLSFKKRYLKKLGLTPFLIAALEASFAVVFVLAGLLFLKVDLPMALMLSAIAAATAPAATVMVLKEYNAKGPVSEMLLSVVALDDAVALILFGFAASFAQTLLSGTGDQQLILSFLEPFLEVGLSLLIGTVLGWLMSYPMKSFRTKGSKVSVLIGFVLLTSSLANALGVSELLANMAAGAIFTNFSMESSLVADLIDELTPPIYLMFFVLSGADLDLAILPSIGMVGLFYVAFRIVGKVLGAYAGARIMKTPAVIRNYLGWTILPQAGVAIGLSTVAERLVPAHGTEIKTIILAATLIFELIGPLMTKIALQKAGEIKVDAHKEEAFMAKAEGTPVE